MTRRALLSGTVTIRHATTTSSRAPRQRGSKPNRGNAAQQISKTDAEKGVRELLKDYRQAYKSLDCKTVIELYPIVKEEIDMHDLRRTFHIMSKFIKYNSKDAQVPTFLAFLELLFADVMQKSKAGANLYPEPSWANNILLPYLTLCNYDAMDRYWITISQDPELFSGQSISLMMQSFHARLTPENTAVLRSKVDELWELSKTMEKTLMHSAVVTTYIDFLNSSGNMELAESIMQEYDAVQTSTLGPSRSRQPYRHMLRHYNNAGDVENTKRYSDLILDHGFLPYGADISLILTHYCNLETLKELETFVTRLLELASQIRSTRDLEDDEGATIRVVIGTLITAKKKEQVEDFNLYQYASDWVKTMELLGIQTTSIAYNLLLDVVSTMPFALTGSEVSERNETIAEKLRETGASPEAALRLTYIGDILSRMQEQKVPPQMSTYRTLIKAYALWSIEGPKMIQMVFSDMISYESVLKREERRAKHRVDARTWAFLARSLLQCDADADAAQRRGTTPKDSPSGLSILTLECQNRLSTMRTDLVAEGFQLIMGEFDRAADSFASFDGKALGEQFFADFMTSLNDEKRQAVQKEYEILVAANELISNQDKNAN